MDADDEGTEVVVFSNEVGECVVGFAGGFLGLLSKGVEGGVVFGEGDVVAVGAGGEKAVDATCLKAFVGDDVFQ